MERICCGPPWTLSGLVAQLAPVKLAGTLQIYMNLNQVFFSIPQLGCHVGGERFIRRDELSWTTSIVHDKNLFGFHAGRAGH